MKKEREMERESQNQLHESKIIEGDLPYKKQY